MKPFSPRELVAQVQAILRRGRLEASKEEKVLSCEGLVLDLEKHKVTVNGNLIQLTPHEFNLLQTLMSSPGKVYTRDQLLARLYPEHGAFVIDQVVDVHIGKLRQKIEEDPSKPRFIVTVRGFGYRFMEGKAL